MPEIGGSVAEVIVEQAATIKHQAAVIEHLRSVILDLCPRVTVKDVADLVAIEADLKRAAAKRKEIREKHNIGGSDG